MARLGSSLGSGSGSGTSSGSGTGSDTGTGTAAAPAVVTPGSIRRFQAQETLVFVGQQFLALAPVAPTSVTAAGWLPGEVVFVDRASLPRDVDRKMTAVNTLWAAGPGAAAAIAEVATSDQVAASRAQWLADQRASGLIDDLLRLLWLAVAAVGALAAVALIETVIAGARDRGRTLSFLRTLGFTTRHGRWLTFGELVPLVLTGVVAGTLAGLGIVALLGPPLGLMVSTGGVTPPALAFDPPFALAVAGCAAGLLVLAVLAETAGRRRDRLAEVLRVGDIR
jgi:putative ABC transport system permease protein